MVYSKSGAYHDMRIERRTHRRIFCLLIPRIEPCECACMRKRPRIDIRANTRLSMSVNYNERQEPPLLPDSSACPHCPCPAFDRSSRCYCPRRFLGPINFCKPQLALTSTLKLVSCAIKAKDNLGLQSVRKRCLLQRRSLALLLWRGWPYG